MADKITPEALKGLLEGSSPFALIDVREAGEYNSSHIPGASLIARRQLEVLMPYAVPFKSASVVLCDDDGRRAQLAAATVEGMGYSHVSVLDGGINRWDYYRGIYPGYPPEGPLGVPGRQGQWATPGSLHTGGCHVLLVDGSVHFLSENIDQVILNRLSWMADGQPMGTF